MYGTMFVFATDLVDEGLETVLDNLQRRGGLSGVSLAVAYHHARDVFPHNPRRKVIYLEGGTTFFRPNPAEYTDTPLQPVASRLAEERDVLAELVAVCERRGMVVHAWTVYLHNSRLGHLHPDLCQENAFGDRYLSNLCPANPAVRAFARALSRDLARRGARCILSESLSYHGLAHGDHHERYFLKFDARVHFLMSLCFCAFCLRAARETGVDGERLRGWVRAELERFFADQAAETDLAELSRAEAAAMAGGEMAGLLRAREQVVTSLTAEVAQEIARGSDTRLQAFDMSGAARGYATGRPQGGPVLEYAWHDGVDVPALAQMAPGIEAIAYAHAPERVRFDVEAYRRVLPADKPLSLAMRPMLPDVDRPENLAAKVRLARELGIAWIDFYHYGFARLQALDWIRQAMEG